VKVWDVRSTKNSLAAKRVLDGHGNAVTSLSWSSSHCDILASGDTSGRVNLWNLRVSPHFVTHSSELFSGGVSSGVLGLEFNPAHPLQIFTCANNGTVGTLELRRDFLTDLVPHRKASPGAGKNSLLATTYEVEKLIYERDLETAYEMVIQ
jgi:WD40 repeat protein